MPSFEEYLRNADNILKNKQPSRALMMLREAHAMNPDDISVIHKLIDTFLILHDYHHAIEFNQKLIDKFPSQVGLWNNHGYLYAQAHEYTKAKEAYLKAIGIDPLFISAHIGYIDVLRASGLFDEAILACQHVIKIAPTRLETFHRLTWSYIIKEKYSEALATANDVLSIDPANVYGFMNRGLIYQLMGLTTENKRDWEDAKSFWHRDKFPEAPNAYCQLGKIWQKLSYPNLAKACYQMALELSPELSLASELLKSISTVEVTADTVIPPSPKELEFSNCEITLATLEAMLLKKIDEKGDALKAELEAHHVKSLSGDEVKFLKNMAAKKLIETSELDHINANTALKEYFDIYKRCIYQSFVACLAINSDMLSPTTASSVSSAIEGAISGASSFFEKFTSSIPFLSQISAVIANTAEFVVTIRISNRVKNLLSCFDSTNAHEQIAVVAVKITLANEALIKAQRSDKTNVLYNFFKELKDKMVVDETDTPAKALAAKHAHEVVMLAMSSHLTEFSHDSIIKLLTSHDKATKDATLFRSASPATFASKFASIA